MKLLFFTESYPYGYGELWKTNELNVLKNFFEHIIVIPLSFAGNRTPVPFINGIEYVEPLFQSDFPVVSSKQKILSVFFSRHIGHFLKEAWTEKVYLSLDKTKKWLEESFKIISITDNSRFRQLIKSVDKNSVVYFYWGRGISEIMAVMKPKSYKTVSRFHGYDLYRERNNGYIPYQRAQIKNIDFSLACSHIGMKTLQRYHPFLRKKISVARIGTISKGLSVPSTDEYLRIVSCSFLHKVKRVEIIAEAMKYLNIKVQWTHIGGGEGLMEIKKIVDEVGDNVRISLQGSMSNEEVISYYVNNQVDLFINVSESEGVPVSIMEALAAGIPVMATNVGGTSEIVNEKSGILLPADITPRGLAGEIEKFSAFSREQKDEKRKWAFEKYNEMCNAEKLAKEFATFLLN
ncbi:glycosyltransferase [Niastella populi]|uniref:Glycosyl transferase family 1 domain-containing protein n=1 Tax=Niastella populi TaxID=550983 RepID=A0A1V9GBA2_9BACT|nr:glycosyltransferase [Niastella populi]OQP67832.1 hypothetical protein A4R26_32615 [Niastella populi]